MSSRPSYSAPISIDPSGFSGAAHSVITLQIETQASGPIVLIRKLSRWQASTGMLAMRLQESDRHSGAAEQLVRVRGVQQSPHRT